MEVQGNRLCLTWWLHPEVVERFAALHQEWKAAVETKSISSWWVYHWGPQTEKIFGGKESPMSDCSHHRHWLSYLSLKPVPVPFPSDIEDLFRVDPEEGVVSSDADA